MWERAYKMTDRETSYLEKTTLRIADVVIKRMEEMKALGAAWQKPWLSSGISSPVATTGRHYKGINLFLLSLLGEMMGYDIPVYATFNDWRKRGAFVKKGEKSVPVIHWSPIFRLDGRRITPEAYDNLPLEIKKNVKVAFTFSVYDEFNVAQTNADEVIPEKVAKWREKWGPHEIDPAATEGMYVNAAIDGMVDGGWICPIEASSSDSAFFQPSTNRIVVPGKAQFATTGTYLDGYRYYEILLHEMAHSTGVYADLKRKVANSFGCPDYAREELVAEMTAATMGQIMGMPAVLVDNSAAYLDNWLSAAKKGGRFIYDVLSDMQSIVNFMVKRMSIVIDSAADLEDDEALA